jgi:hypothetical protein
MPRTGVLVISVPDVTGGPGKAPDEPTPEARASGGGGGGKKPKKPSGATAMAVTDAVNAEIEALEEEVGEIDPISVQLVKEPGQRDSVWLLYQYEGDEDAVPL